MQNPIAEAYNSSVSSLYHCYIRYAVSHGEKRKTRIRNKTNCISLRIGDNTFYANTSTECYHLCYNLMLMLITNVRL